MKITLTHISNLLKLFEKGLINGAGQDVNHFCVQQAVHRVIDNDLDGQKSDRPPSWCVLNHIVRFGICMNDQGGWSSNRNRAKGLQRFAIAELGSDKISASAFYKKLAVKLADITGDSPDDFSQNDMIIHQFLNKRKGGFGHNDWATILANKAADTLQDLGTEGSKFLYLLDEPDPEKRHKKAKELGHQIYAAQLAEDRHKWGTDISFGMPIKGHHKDNQTKTKKICHINID